MKLLREMLLGIALAMSLIGTATVALPSPTPQTVDEVRITALEKLGTTVDDHERRLIRVEDAVMGMQDTRNEFTWWLRFIGGAIALAIAERVLRTAGVLGKSDGGGPVG